MDKKAKAKAAELPLLGDYKSEAHRSAEAHAKDAGHGTATRDGWASATCLECSLKW